MSTRTKPWRSLTGWRKPGKNEPFRPKVISVLIAAEACVFLVVLLFTVIVIRREKTAAVQERRNEQLMAISEGVSGILSELRLCTQDAWQITLDVVGDTELFSTPKPDSYLPRYAAWKKIDDLCRNSSDIGYVFAVREDSFFLGNSGSNRYLTQNLGTWLKNQAGDDFSELRTAEWSVVSWNEKSYFLTYYRYAQMDTYIGLMRLTEDFTENLPGQTSGVTAFYTISDASGNLMTLGTESIPDGFAFSYSVGDTGLTISGTLDDSVNIHTWNTVIFTGMAALLSIFIASLIIHKFCLKPIAGLSQELRNVQGDLKNISISVDSGMEELHTLQDSASYLLNEVVASRIRQYELKLKENELELMGLHAQLLPHFYLNAITTVDTLNRQGRSRDIETFLRALTVHIRYMIRANNKPILLGEELDHISAYITMQEIRCPNQAIPIIDAPEELRSVMIPHLLVYTVVENSFKYAVEAGNPLIIMIRAEKTGNELHVIVEDNGKGFSSGEISAYNGMAPIPEPPEGHGRIGLRNVKRTLKLRYERDDLLRISNHEPHGATVELIFPLSGNATEGAIL